MIFYAKNDEGKFVYSMTMGQVSLTDDLKKAYFTEDESDFKDLEGYSIQSMRGIDMIRSLKFELYNKEHLLNKIMELIQKEAEKGKKKDKPKTHSPS